MQFQKQPAQWRGVLIRKLWSTLVFTSSLLFVSALHAETLRVIAHASVEEAALSRNTARAIFSMRLKQWSDGQSITVFVLPDSHPVHRQFSREVLSLFPHQLRRSWDRYVYSGIGTAPIEVESEEDMQARIGATPGSIGYIQKEIMDEKVRTLEVR